MQKLWNVDVEMTERSFKNCRLNYTQHNMTITGQHS